jgi:AcrR family transcriptional regulator
MGEPARKSSNSRFAPRWRRLPEERPGQIIEAAFRVFGEQGLQRARLEDVAHEAGVSKGTIYLYFDSKEALFREVVRSKIVSAIEQGEREFGGEGAGPGRGELRAFARFHWEYVTSPVFQTMYRLVNSDLVHFPDLAAFYGREVIDRSMRLLAGVLSRAMTRGELRPVDPQFAARVFASMFITHGVWYTRRAQFGTFVSESAEALRDSLFDFFMQAVAAAPAPTDRSTP